MSANEDALSRRELLAMSASTLALGLFPGIGRGQALQPVADAHLHLFNASDLPLKNFVNYVLIPRFVDGPPPRWARALVHMFERFYKRRAVTVEREMSWLSGAQAADPPPLWTPDEYAAEATRFVKDRLRGSKSRPAAMIGEPTLAQSYGELVQAVAIAAGLRQPAADLLSAAPTAATGAAWEANMRFAFRVVAEGAETGMSPTASGVPSLLPNAATPAANACPEEPFELGWATVRRLLGWGYLLLKSRGQHIEEYLDHHGTGSHRPAVLLNFLVDYDYWLDDGPRKASSHKLQIELMARLASKYSGRAQIKTFAGFCPLRFAIERRGSRGDWFDRYDEQVEAGKIAGFKLYPPMGFRPSNNIGLVEISEDQAFEPSFPGLRSGLQRWRKVAGQSPLAPELDKALEEFFAYCARRNLPVMAHAGPGNQAGRGYGGRANPLYWRAVAEKHRIRLSLGHLVNNAKHFVKALASPQPYPGCVWSLHAPVDLLDTRRTDFKAAVYGDLGYMPELIGNPRLQKEFFSGLRQVFGPGDRHLTRILYGTDWLMLGHERDNRQYLDVVLQGMEAANYTAVQKENILHNNAMRFLTGRPA